MLPQVLREEPQFRLLFLGQALSVLGDRMVLVVLPFAVLSTPGAGTAEVGYVAAAQTVPFLLFALTAGVLADRFERRKVMIASDLVRAAVQLTAGVLLLSGSAEWWHLAVLAFVFGTGDAFFMPAMTGLLPLTLSEPHQLQPANAVRGLSFHAGSIGGPVIAAGLLAATGPGEALLLDALTFLVSVAALARLKPRAVERATDAPPSAFLRELREGWQEVRSRSWVMGFLAAMAVYHVVVLPSVFVLGPVLADEELGGPSAWAAISVAFGVGSVVGDVALLRFRPRRALRTAAVALALGSCQAVVFGSGLPLALICLLEVGAAIGVAAAFTLWEATLQEHIPSHALSRVSSYDYLATGGLMPLGTAVAGPVAAATDVHTALAVMSALGITAALACLLLPSVRTLPRADGPATASPGR